MLIVVKKLSDIHPSLAPMYFSTSK